jgi:NADH-quinone oxidoreductase subunit M
MMPVWLIAILMAGGLLCWPAGRWRPAAARWTALATLALGLLFGVGVLIRVREHWPVEINVPWITVLGIRFHLAVDNLSALLIVLTYFLGLIAVACSWKEITRSEGFFFFSLLWVLAGIIGVFSALDLFLFYFFWELMMVPMFFLIAVWGHEKRIYAAVKFFLFTQLGGLFMLAAIVALYFLHGRATGVYTFDYAQLLGTVLPSSTAMWLMLGFLVAFAVKLPAFPVHSWLPDAHTEAPTAGSVVLAGLLLKTGAYGMLRFVVPLFPEAARAFAPVAMVLAVIAVLYGALLAFAQTDLKRLVAYTSISHMGFVMLAVFAWNELALQGAVIQMICHGISTGALFVIVGMLQERLHTRDLRRMGGLWAQAPRMGGVTLLFALASLGLPGLGNFVGEFMILLGVFPVYPIAAIIAALGLVAASIYALWIVQHTFHGGSGETRHLHDLTGRESAIMAALGIAIVWLGLYPQPVIRIVRPALTRMVYTRDLVSTPRERGAAARFSASRATGMQGDPDAAR